MNVVYFACILLLSSLATVRACGESYVQPPPPPPPPPNAPPVPAAPPPINKVIRQAVQTMTRNNCQQVQVTAQNNAALMTSDTEAVQQAAASLNVNECLNAENYAYSCTFTVYSEISLTTIYHPTGCGCAFTIQVVKPRPALPSISNVLSVNAAYNTTVTRFSIVVYDTVAEQEEAEIPQFSNMALDASTTAAIVKQVNADPDGDYTSITAGFAGTIQSFSTLPSQLNYNDPANANYVPAIAFTIEQQYQTGAMFTVPCSVDLSTAPNAYMSQCQPFRPTAPFTYSKRAAHDVEQNATTTPDTVWFREFYLFPKTSNTCGKSGYTPQSRYITSFFDNSDCSTARGYLSFDREFTSTQTASNAVVGGWVWTRTFSSDPRMVFGVPQSFSSLQQTWCLGYSQIEWASPSNWLPSQRAVDVGVCQAYPTTGFTSAVQSNKYGESQPSYSAVATGVNCAPAFVACGGDVTLLAFQNRDPRDFSKNAASTLLTGPRRLFCSQASQDGATMVVFDTLTFVGVPAGQALAKKRGVHHHELHMVYDAERDGLVHARHHPLLAAEVNRALRKRGEANLVDATPVAGAPHRDNFATTTAAGSVDTTGSDGASAGDHPLRNFPVSYSAPLTLDPVQAASPDEPLVYDGQPVTGAPQAFCTQGELGCQCRDASATSLCDTPFTCNTLNYCVNPPCPAGDAGCPAQSDGSCNVAGLTSVNGFCEYAATCTAGALGCTCAVTAANANGTCVGDSAQCLDGQCIVSQMGVCADGEAGCPCTASTTCNGGTVCDADSGMCLFEVCQAGTAGCKCSTAAGGSPCADGFTCSEGACVQTSCDPGTAGCPCLSGRACGVQGYTCVDLRADGSESACMAENLCPGGQDARCLQVCGAGNVAVCGQCIYTQPICRDPTPLYCTKGSYLYGLQPCPLNSHSSAALASLASLALAAAIALVM